MSGGEDGSPPLSETKRYNGVVVQLRKGRNKSKVTNRNPKNSEIARDDAGEQEPLFFAREQSLPAAKVGMKVSFNIRPWGDPSGTWDYEAVNITVLGHAPENEPGAKAEPEKEPEKEPGAKAEPEKEPGAKAEPSLSELTVPQLKARCKELGLSAYSKLRKAELVSILEKSPEPKRPTGATGPTGPIGGKEKIARLMEFAHAKLDGYQIGDGPIEEGREFEGKFIDYNFTIGWQSHIECDALGLVYTRQTDSIEGSMKVGEKVRFKVIVHKDNRGDKQWKAVEWKSDIRRRLAVPPLTVVYPSFPTEKIMAWLDANDDPVLAVIMMSDSVINGKRKVPSRLVKKSRLEKKIADELPGYPTTVFNWPLMDSHKMIKDHVACSVLIHRPGYKPESGSEFTKCHSGRRGQGACWNCLPCRLMVGVVKAAYEKQIFLQSNRRDWVILGDETGGLGEMVGKAGHRQSRMLWVVVPPRTVLPPLHPLFHAQDPELFGDETLKAFEVMANERDRVNTFVFTYEKGAVPKALRGVEAGAARIPHLAFWQFTLPLVMEYVFSKAEKGDSMRIYVERMGDENQLAPRGQTLAALVQEFAELYERRLSGGRISGIEQRVLEKHPLEHAWLGYCDAIGLLNDGEVQPEWRAPIQKIKETCFEAPFRQDSLNSGIRMLLKATGQPLVFLKSLSEIPLNDMRDYVIPFLSSTISDCISALNKGQWQDLLEHMKHTSKDKKGQNATNLIYRHVATPEVLAVLTRPHDRFDFLLAMLGTANHVGSVRTARECRGHLDDMIEKEYKPKPERKKKMVILTIGMDDNIFDFRHIDESLWMKKFPEDVNDVDEEDAHFYGTQAQSRALRNRDDDFTQAWAIEKYLELRSKIQENESHIRRRWVIRAELLLMEPRRAEEALVALTGSETGEGGLPGLVSDSVGELMGDQYYLVPLLKSCALLAKGESEFRKYTETVTSVLNHDHPSQRIAYWCARWADEIGLKEDRVSKECLRHIVKMTDIEANFPEVQKMDEVTKGRLMNFGEDAPGVILACELLDLEKGRGLIDCGAQAFLDRVLSDSDEKTREWVKAHQPDEEDWLRPLNFNYR